MLSGGGRTHRRLKLFLIFCACCIVCVRTFRHIDNTCTSKNNNFKLLWSDGTMVLNGKLTVPGGPTNLD